MKAYLNLRLIIQEDDGTESVFLKDHKGPMDDLDLASDLFHCAAFAGAMDEETCL